MEATALNLEGKKMEERRWKREDGSNCTEPFEEEERRQKREKRWKQMKKEGRGKRTTPPAAGWISSRYS